MSTPKRAMRAKLKVTTVAQHEGGAETLKFNAVCSSGFGPEGQSEDNAFAHYTPSANLEMLVNNPELAGKFKPGDTFYLDFIPA